MVSKKYKIKSFKGNIEPHEVFLDKLAKTKEEQLGITQKRFELILGHRLLYLIFGIFIIFSLALLAKVFYLQVTSGQYLSGLSEKNRVRNEYVQAERGVIYDKNMRQMVANSPAYDLVCDKRDLSGVLTDNTDEIDKVAKIVGQNPQELGQKIKDSVDSQVLIAENLPQETLVLLESEINQFPGFQIISNTVRNYAEGSLFADLLGHMGKINKDELSSYKDYSISDYIGKVGLEKSYEDVLRGTPGVVEVQKDAMNRKKDEKIQSQPQDGKSLVLYLDSDLQKQLTAQLQRRLDDMKLKKGAAVAIDPRTGGILAMVSIPSFDNNIFSSAISTEDFQKIQNDPLKPFLNRAIAGQYPPGSTIKPLIGSGVLQSKIISPDKEITDKGYIDVKSPYDPTVVYHFGGLEKPGQYSMRTAIAYSSNIYFYTVGGGYGTQKGLGPTKIKDYLQLFGLDQDTNVDLPGEANGFIPTPDYKKQVTGQNWQDGDTYHLSIGQGGLTVTPLQLAMGYCAIANGGTLYQPEAVKKIVDTTGGSIKVVKNIEPVITRQNFIDPANLKIIREGMRLGVTLPDATGRVLQSLPVPAASKTGTAQTGKDGIYDIWASVFAPYDNPQILVTVVVEDVNGLYIPALNVAKDTLQWYFTR